METKDKKSKKEKKQNTEDSDKKKAGDKKGKKNSKAKVISSAPFTNCKAKKSFRCYSCAVKRHVTTVCLVSSDMSESGDPEASTL